MTAASRVPPSTPDPRPGTATLETEGGLRASVDGQPALAALPYSTRLIVEASAAADVMTRTALASVLSVPMLTWALPHNARRDREQLAFYRELAEAADATATFPAPQEGAPVQALPAPRHAFAPSDGQVQVLRLDSAFKAVNPAVRDSYAAFSESHVAWAQHWCHDESPRPTLCVIHGFGASAHWINSAFFNLPRLFGCGYDILLYVLPFHGARQSRAAPFSGWGLFAHGLAHFNEAILHGIHDLRVFIDRLFEQGVGQVGVTGISLGGYTAALLAAVDERIAVSIPNAPVVSMGPLIRQWFPTNILAAGAGCLTGTDSEARDRALAVHSPLTYKALVAPEQLMIIGGLGDRLAPPEQSRMLWEHWDHCRLHWFPGNHIVHLNRRLYLDEMLAFMQGNGFAA